MHKILFNKPLQQFLRKPKIHVEIIKENYKTNNVMTEIKFQEIDIHKTVEYNVVEMG